jgi:hypothetical protein
MSIRLCVLCVYSVLIWTYMYDCDQLWQSDSLNNGRVQNCKGSCFQTPEAKDKYCYSWSRSVVWRAFARLHRVCVRECIMLSAPVNLNIITILIKIPVYIYNICVCAYIYNIIYIHIIIIVNHNYMITYWISSGITVPNPGHPHHMFFARPCAVARLCAGRRLADIV